MSIDTFRRYYINVLYMNLNLFSKIFGKLHDHIFLENNMYFGLERQFLSIFTKDTFVGTFKKVLDTRLNL